MIISILNYITCVTELKILTLMCCLYLVSSALMLIVVLFLAILCVLMCDVICNDVMKLVPTDQRQLTYSGGPAETGVMKFWGPHGNGDPGSL